MLPLRSTQREATLVVGRWRLLHPMPMGAMGEAWVACDEGGTEVVLKRLDQPPGDELRALAAVVHPSVPTLIGAGSYPFPHVVMDRVHGVVASSILADGRLSSSDVADVLCALADALTLCHARGLFHGDISAENLIITEDSASLVDFGLAGSPEGGTSAFMAPERFEGLGGAAADVYSLGVACWSLLEGATPPIDTRLKGPLVTSHAPAWLSDLMGRMTRLDPAARPSAQDVFGECVSRGIAAPRVSAEMVRRRSASLWISRPHVTYLRRWMVGRGHLAIVGDSGMGRSRTLSWTEDELVAAGVDVVRLQPTNIDFDAIRGLARHPRLPGSPVSLVAPPGEARVFEAVDALLQRMGPVCSFLVDGDGLDADSVEVIRLLANDSRVSVLWAGVEAPSWIPRRRRLTPWSLEASEQLVAQLLGAPCPKGLGVILKDCSGSPQRVVAHVLQAVADGALERAADVWRIDEEALRATVANMGPSQLAGLSIEALRLGAAVASWERRIDIDVLSSWLPPMSPRARERAVHQLTAAGLAILRGSTLRVAGARTRDELLAACSDEQARGLAFAHLMAIGGSPDARWCRIAVRAGERTWLEEHAAAIVGAAIATHPPDGAALGDWLWSHGICGADLALARLRSFAQGGRENDAAAALSTLTEAHHETGTAVLAMMALGHGDVQGATEWCDTIPENSSNPELLLARAHVAGASGDLDRAHTLARRVLDRCGVMQRVGGGAALVVARCLRVLGSLDEAHELLLTVPAASEPLCKGELGYVLSAKGLFRDAAQVFQEAASEGLTMSMANRASLWNMAANSCHRAGDMERAVSLYARAVRVFERLGMGERAAGLECNRMEASRALGYFGQARRSFTRALELAQGASSAQLEVLAYSNAIDLDLDEGLLDLAYEHLGLADAVRANNAMVRVDVELEGRRAQVASDLLQPRAPALVRQALELAVQHDDIDVASRMHVILGRTCAAASDVEGVYEHLKAALDPLQAAGKSGELAHCRAGFAEVLLALGQLDEGRTLATQVRAWADEFGRKTLRIRADRVLTDVRQHQSRALDAERRLSRMVELSVEVLAEHRPDQVLASVAAAALELTGADRAFVVEQGAPPRVLCGATVDGELGEPSWSVVSRSLNRQREVLVCDLAERDDLNRARSVQKMRLQAALCVPFDVRGSLRGVIYVDRVGESFDRMQALTGVMRFLAGFAGVALTNAEVFLESRQRVVEARELAHDLANVLTAVGLVTEQPPLSPKDIEQIQRGAGSANTMVKRFLRQTDHSREPYDAVEAIGDWIRPSSYVGRARGVAVSFRAPSVPVPMIGDVTELRRAVSNILSNAMKYAPDGSEVRVALVAEERRVIVLVSDDGPGIPQGYEEAIFEPETKGPNARAGHGLGLTIARRVAREHGGTLHAVPVEVGACFELVLPILGTW